MRVVLYNISWTFITLQTNTKNVHKYEGVHSLGVSLVLIGCCSWIIIATHKPTAYLITWGVITRCNGRSSRKTDPVVGKKAGLGNGSSTVVI